MEFIENIAALRLDWKDIDENSTVKKTRRKTQIKTYKSRKI